MRVDDYFFGRLRVAGRTLDADVVLWPHRIEERWWRRRGHSLCLADLEAVLRTPPRRLVVGLGFYGRMTVPAGIRTALEDLGIDVVALPTPEAVHLWNAWLDEPDHSDIVAALHLTC